MDTFWENTYLKKHSGSGSPEAQLTSLIKKCYVTNAGPQLTSMMIKQAQKLVQVDALEILCNTL